MTLLNTISNIGSSWPSTVSLYAVDILSFMTCSIDRIKSFKNNINNNSYNSGYLFEIQENTCSNEKMKIECLKFNGNCEYKVDAFYILGFVFALIGLIWIFYFRQVVKKLQSYQKLSWKLNYSF